jgi:flagellar hook-associated protein 2
MALSAPGIGANLDVAAIVAQLMRFERRPLALLDRREAGVQAKLSAYAQIRAALAGLQTALDALAAPATFGARKTSLADPSLVAVTAGPQAAVATHSVEVRALARAHLLKSESFAGASAVVGRGTLRIETGRYQAQGDDVVFVASGPAREIAIAAGGDTLEAVRAAINASPAGVQATIVNESANSSHLVLAATATGLGHALRITVSGDADGNDTDASGLSRLIYDASLASGTPAPSHLSEVQAAADAVMVLDGIAIVRSSNTIEDAADGLVFTLLRAAPDTPTALAVVPDRSRAQAAVEAFVKSYNEALAALRKWSGVDPATGRGSVLFGEGTVQAIESRLRALAFAHAESGSEPIRSLSDAGVRFQRDGTLALERERLAAAFDTAPRALAALFSASEHGIAVKMRDALAAMLAPAGPIAARTAGLDTRLRGIEREREALDERLARIEERLRAQFMALDGLIASMRKTSDFLQAQLAALQQRSR